MQGNPKNIQLNAANPIWMNVPEGPAVLGGESRYLLLEDAETHDILFPLMYMKEILKINYSRKLSSLKYRSLKYGSELLHWEWAFEAPQIVKAIARRLLGDALPRGHLSLVPLPIVYNALSHSEELRNLPMFGVLHSAMMNSSYKSLIHPLDSGIEVVCENEMQLFKGPHDYALTLSKYALNIHLEVENNKRRRVSTILPIPFHPIIGAAINMIEQDRVHILETHVHEMANEIDALKSQMRDMGIVLGMLVAQNANANANANANVPIPYNAEGFAHMVHSAFLALQQVPQNEHV